MTNSSSLWCTLNYDVFEVQTRPLQHNSYTINDKISLTVDNEVEDHEGGHKAERTGGSDARVMP